MNKEALKDLNNFNGTENYYQHGPLFPNVVYSDGVQFLAVNADCFWLIDAIASWQPKCQKDESLRDMQFWTLRPHQVSDTPQPGENRAMATLVCERDTDDVAFSQDIPFTDFPFEAFPKKEVKMWVSPTSLDGEKTVQVIYLPSEH